MEAVNRAAVIGAAVAFAMSTAAPAAARTDITEQPLIQQSLTIAGQHFAPLASGCPEGHPRVLDSDLTAVPAWGQTPSYYGCVIFIDLRALADSRAFGRRPASTKCQVVVHEYGHTLGLGHSDDPDDVMSRSLGATLPQCALLDLPRVATTRRQSTKSSRQHVGRRGSRLRPR